MCKAIFKIKKVISNLFMNLPRDKNVKISIWLQGDFYGFIRPSILMWTSKMQGKHGHHSKKIPLPIKVVVGRRYGRTVDIYAWNRDRDNHLTRNHNEKSTTFTSKDEVIFQDLIVGMFTSIIIVISTSRNGLLKECARSEVSYRSKQHAFKSVHFG